MLPYGDLTEVGERVCGCLLFLYLFLTLYLFQGISLSGGQKQRVNICRAIYCDTDIQIFDVCVHSIELYPALLLNWFHRTPSLHWTPMSAGPFSGMSSRSLEKRAFWSHTLCISFHRSTTSTPLQAGALQSVGRTRS